MTLEDRQRENWKKKHSMRLFLEERLVDLGIVFMFFANMLCSAVDFGYVLVPKAKQFVTSYRMHSMLVLAAALILFTMFW